MFSRYALGHYPDLVLKELDILPPDYAPRYNIGPPQQCPAILQEYRESPNIQGLRWGLLPYWAEDEREGLKSVNAKVEELAEDRRFAEALPIRRCLIPATGFYLWRTEKGSSKRTPFYFESKSAAKPLVFAGLWERWGSPAKRIRSCTIITASADAALSTFTDRMPVVLAREDWLPWLDPNINEVDVLLKMLVRSTGVALTYWQVSPYVNRSTNEGERCIEPVTDN